MGLCGNHAYSVLDVREIFDPRFMGRERSQCHSCNQFVILGFLTLLTLAIQESVAWIMGGNASNMNAFIWGDIYIYISHA